MLPILRRANLGVPPARAHQPPIAALEPLLSLLEVESLPLLTATLQLLGRFLSWPQPRIVMLQQPEPLLLLANLLQHDADEGMETRGSETTPQCE